MARVIRVPFFFCCENIHFNQQPILIPSYMVLDTLINQIPFSSIHNTFSATPLRASLQGLTCSAAKILVFSEFLFLEYVMSFF